MKFVKAHGLGNDFILVAAADCARGDLGLGAAALRPAPRRGRRRRDPVRACRGRRVACASSTRTGPRSSSPATACAAWPRSRCAPAGPRRATRSSPCRARGRWRSGALPARATRSPPTSVPRSWRATASPWRSIRRSRAWSTIRCGRGPATVRVTATSLGQPALRGLPRRSARRRARWPTLGPALERHPFFPRKTNVEFVSRRPGATRSACGSGSAGVGPTQSSGTGSASAAVAAILNGRADRQLRVVCDGGTLEVEWPEGGHVRQARRGRDPVRRGVAGVAFRALGPRDRCQQTRQSVTNPAEWREVPEALRDSGHDLAQKWIVVES